MDKSDKNKIKLQLKPDATFPVGQAAQVISAYRKLFAVLNNLGYFPESPEDAKRIAKALLDQGWEEE